MPPLTNGTRMTDAPRASRPEPGSTGREPPSGPARQRYDAACPYSTFVNDET